MERPEHKCGKSSCEVLRDWKDVVKTRSSHPVSQSLFYTGKYREPTSSVLNLVTIFQLQPNKNSRATHLRRTRLSSVYNIPCTKSFSQRRWLLAQSHTLQRYHLCFSSTTTLSIVTVAWPDSRSPQKNTANVHATALIIEDWIIPFRTSSYRNQ